MKRLRTMLASFVLALLFVGAGGTANAAMYHAFCKGGVASKEILVARMEKSYAANHDGSVRLEGCQANLIQFYTAFKQGDPTAKNLASVADVASYTAKLIPMTPDRDIKYFSSCVRGKSAGADDVVMSCQPQFIKATVAVYGNPETGRMTLKLDCANPGLVPVILQSCVYVFAEIRSGQTPDTNDAFISAGAFGNVTAEEEKLCPISVQGPFPDGTKLAANGYRLLAKEQAHPCDWTDVTQALKLPLHTSGCIRVTAGWYAFRLPARFATSEALRFVLCKERASGRTSIGAGVPPSQYHLEKDGARVAVVRYEARSGDTVWWVDDQ